MSHASYHKGRCIVMFDNGDGSITIAKGYANTLVVTQHAPPIMLHGRMVPEYIRTELELTAEILTYEVVSKPADWEDDRALPEFRKGLPG